MLQPIASVRVVDVVRDRLRSAILSGDIAPGSRLSVPELARQLGVSRSPVREAVLLLVGEGLAVEQSRRGVEVARLELTDVLELYDLRTNLEGLAARLAAERMTSSDLAALRGVLDAQGAAAVGDARSFRELDHRFHEIVSQTCGNTRLARHAALLAREMRLAGPLMVNEPWHLKQSHQEHRAIEHALRQRDGPAAENAMRVHLSRVCQSVRHHNS
ncbi:GntR family transcriptional regulator [Deinococcus arenicola]|uniref:GntR family transcriptional regulator n=1 Tax=Deinococcus arenicola TaxID=2994950 RepID=A0ABU4DSC2_9DEIO|nr:GntR family transcriptional regulator [Deinococcus sp. ZS9-10]MDV6375331.1 GntR family transcriptional regulator [Deinococcus sp. ZS9-10]